MWNFFMYLSHTSVAIDSGTSITVPVAAAVVKMGLHCWSILHSLQYKEDEILNSIFFPVITCSALPFLKLVLKPVYHAATP